jgi:hypothetical protein
MGNYASRQIQLESETKNIFDRLMNKNTIEKSDVMGLVNKFKALKKENPAQYTTIANRANSLNSVFKKVSQKGRVKPQDWDKLKLIHQEFKGLIAA